MHRIINAYIPIKASAWRKSNYKVWMVYAPLINELFRMFLEHKMNNTFNIYQ